MKPRPGAPLPAEFYARDTKRVARALLGCLLESHAGGHRTAGRIVEVEAYVGPDDPADHGYGNRRTPRNAALFGPPGTSYVYFIYGMHWCFNAVTERVGLPTAVLVRAVEPIAGLEIMEERRGTRDRARLCAGPARLCQALGITGGLNGSCLADGPVRILASGSKRHPRVLAGPRIGVAKAASWPLRFVDGDSRYVSRRVR